MKELATKTIALAALLAVFVGPLVYLSKVAGL